jgi:hypothetical protein
MERLDEEAHDNAAKCIEHERHRVARVRQAERTRGPHPVIEDATVDAPVASSPGPRPPSHAATMIVGHSIKYGCRSDVSQMESVRGRRA